MLKPKEYDKSHILEVHSNEYLMFLETIYFSIYGGKNNKIIIPDTFAT